MDSVGYIYISVHLIIYVIITLRVEEMVQQLIVLTSFPNDLGLIPSTYMAVHNYL